MPRPPAPGPRVSSSLLALVIGAVAPILHIFPVMPHQGEILGVAPASCARPPSLVVLTPSFCIMFLPALGRLYRWYFVCFGCFLPSDLGFLRFLRFLHPRFSVTCLVFIPCLLSPVGFTSRFYP